MPHSDPFPQAEKADFNMAAATLERIHTSLEKIRQIFEYFPMGVLRQQMHLDEVKIFFMMASPLLNSTTVERYGKEIDALSIPSKIVRSRKVSYYDSEKEKRLFQIVREIEIELKQYFMKYKPDPSRAILPSN